MKITTWNVNGIRAIHRKGFFVKFVKDYDPDVICLQETKAHQGQSEVDLPQYEEYWNSAESKGYSGTAIFTKIKPIRIENNIDTKIADKFSVTKDNYGNTNNEGRVITAEFKDFFLVNVYTPNAKEDLSRLNLRHKHWDPAFLAYCRSLDSKKPVILCGDLNVAHTEDDLARPKENQGVKGFTKEEREAIDNFIKSDFIDAFRLFKKGNGYYTWWSHFAKARERNIGWRIDYFFVSKRFSKKIKKVEILKNVLGSDHCPVIIELK